MSLIECIENVIDIRNNASRKTENWKTQKTSITVKL